MVVKKDPTALARFHHPDFVLCTNGTQQTYEEFKRGHEKVYGTEITHAVRYDDEAWAEGAGKLGARVWIETKRPGEAATEFGLMLVASHVDGLIHRLRELTRLDWTQVKAFDDYGHEDGHQAARS